MSTVLASSAVSNIVYYYGMAPEAGNNGGAITMESNLTVVDYQNELPQIADPQIDDVALVMNGQDGGYDVAVYTGTGWVVKPLRGLRGLTGERGPQGVAGAPGANGVNGQDGAPGPAGQAPAHEWVGTSVRFTNPDGSWGELIDLSGTDGINGTNGLNGAKGDKPAHEWLGTQLRFQNPDGTWGAWVELKGADGVNGINGVDGAQGPQGPAGANGAPGPQGPMPDHLWTGENLQFQKPDGTWGEAVFLRGDDGSTPEIGANNNWWIGGVDTGVPVRRQNNKEEFELDGSFITYPIEMTPDRVMKFGQSVNIVAEFDNGEKNPDGTVKWQITQVPVNVYYIAGVKNYEVFVNNAVGKLTIS